MAYHDALVLKYIEGKSYKEIAETLGSALDPMGDGEAVPPAIAPLERTMRLATLVQQVRGRMGDPVDAGEAVRLARMPHPALPQLRARLA